MKRLTKLMCLFFVVASQSALAAFNVPSYQTYQMDNGLTVYLMQQSEVPLIDVQLVVRAGATLDGQNYGLANLTSESLRFGSGELSKNDIEDLLAFHGAEFGAFAAAESAGISLSIASKDQTKMLKLFRDIAIEPAFNAVEFEKYQQRLVSQLTQRRESPRNVIYSMFGKMYYGDHPYGNPVSGDAKSVANLNLNQVKQFYGDYYSPSNSALIVVGDFEPEAMKKQLTQLFAGWKGPKVEKQSIKPAKLQKKPRVMLVNKGDAIETTFMVGGKGIPSSHPDFVASQVINTILGGRFTSWLNDELRVNSGLTYGARSRFVDHAVDGHFVISTFTKTETTYDALDLALKTYGRIWDKGIDKQTLDSAKAYVKGQFPPRYETSGQLASLLSRMWVLGLSDSVINNFEAQVSALDVKKANALARELFPKENLQIVLIGQSSKIRDKAKDYGEVYEADIKSYHF